MLPDQARRADTHAWLAKARMDLRSAEHALAASPPLLEDALFHSQQAAEKALKALLTWHDAPFRKTHSIEELGHHSIGIAPALRPVVDAAVPLSEYAWKFRYPGESETPDQAEAENALRVAGEVVAGVIHHLPADMRS